MQRNVSIILSAGITRAAVLVIVLMLVPALTGQIGVNLLCVDNGQ